MLRLVAFALLLQPPAREEKPSLYVVENVVEQGVIKPRNLVRLSIDREGRLVKQVILSQDGILSHFEHGAVFGPRHVVTDRGSIIDVSTGKLLSKDLGEFLGVEKGKAYFRRTGKELKRQVSSFDFFDDGKVAALADAGHWALRGAKSPNKTMTASLWLIVSLSQPKTKQCNSAAQ